MLADLGWSHVLILGGILVVLFGAKRFPEIGRSIGQGISHLVREIKGGFDDEPSSLPPHDKDEHRFLR